MAPHVDQRVLVGLVTARQARPNPSDEAFKNVRDASLGGHAERAYRGQRSRMTRDRGSLPTGHEDVFTTVVVERFARESAVESFEAQARDVEEPQPFVLGGPPK
jgi:hypothetical protein